MKAAGLAEIGLGIVLGLIWVRRVAGNETVGTNFATAIAVSTLVLLGVTTHHIASALKSKKDYFY